jgi:hypothetical protein
MQSDAVALIDKRKAQPRRACAPAWSRVWIPRHAGLKIVTTRSSWGSQSRCRARRPRAVGPGRRSRVARREVVGTSECVGIAGGAPRWGPSRSTRPYGTAP